MEGLRIKERQDLGKFSRDVNVLIPVTEEFLRVDYSPVQRFSQEYVRNGITIGISKNLDEIALIRTQWELKQKQESQNTPDTDYNKYISVTKSVNGQVEPFVMYFKKYDKLLAMVIGRIEIKPLDLRIGYLTLCRPKVKSLSIVYGGIMGQADDTLCITLLDELTKQLKAQQADLIQFHYLKTDTSLYRLLQNQYHNVALQVRTDKHWRMAIPDTIEKFYSVRSKGHRYNLRKAKSRIEKEFSGEIKHLYYSTEAEVDDFLKIATSISQKTYQHALNAGLVNDLSTQLRLKAEAANGWFRGHILFAGNKPCAFQLGSKYGNIYYMMNIGYDPEFKSYKPGLVLFLNVIEKLCEDSSIDSVDFYFGDAEYKYRFGTEYWQEATMYIFAQRIYPIFIKKLQVATLCLNECLKNIINKTGYTEQLKQKWRNLLSAKVIARKNTAAENV